MDEARAVLHRLARIDALEREGAPARSLLAEVHALVEDPPSQVDLSAFRCSNLRCRRQAGPQTSASGRPLNGSPQTAQGLVVRG
jgi:hypothetical protein